MLRATYIVLLLALCAAPAWAAPPRKLAVIVHPQNPTKTISMAFLRAVFTQKVRRWSNGKKVLVINHVAGNPTRIAFDRVALKMTPRQAADFWIREQIRGRGRPPISIKRARLIPRIIARSQSAIAYVWADQLPSTVRALKIDNKGVSDATYPLVVHP
jgi:hypothetical protein